MRGLAKRWSELTALNTDHTTRLVAFSCPSSNSSASSAHALHAVFKGVGGATGSAREA